MGDKVTVVYTDDNDAAKSIRIVRVDGNSRYLPANVHQNACHRQAAFAVLMKVAGWRISRTLVSGEGHTVETYMHD